MDADSIKIEQVIAVLDHACCTCGQRPDSPVNFGWKHRMCCLCRICDADLILKYGYFTPEEGGLNSWSAEGRAELDARIAESFSKAGFRRR